MICRQLDFPQGVHIDPSINPAEADGDILEYGAFDQNFALTDAEEAQEPQVRFWLADAVCNGREEQVFDCDLGAGFLDGQDEYRECSPAFTSRLTVACRMFPIAGTTEVET